MSAPQSTLGLHDDPHLSSRKRDVGSTDVDLRTFALLPSVVSNARLKWHRFLGYHWRILLQPPLFLLAVFQS